MIRTPSPTRAPSETGVILITMTAVMWGFMPLYFIRFDPFNAFEFVSYRILTTVLFLGSCVLVLHQLADTRALFRNRRMLTLLVCAAFFTAGNVGLFAWAVSNGRALEGALGLYLIPLLSVFLGVIVLRERLRPLQWAALAIACVAMVVLGIDYGRPPWTALGVSSTFAIYSLLKKSAAAPAIPGFLVENILIAPAAIGVLIYLIVTGGGTITGFGAWHTTLLLSTGLITGTPLISFAYAATRVKLSTLGLVQYINPSIQLVIGVTILHVDISPGRFAAVGLIWIALSCYMMESRMHRRSSLRRALEADGLSGVARPRPLGSTAE